MQFTFRSTTAFANIHKHIVELGPSLFTSCNFSRPAWHRVYCRYIHVHLDERLGRGTDVTSTDILQPERPVLTDRQRDGETAVSALIVVNSTTA